MIASLVFEEPAAALTWTKRVLEQPEAHSLWGATLLFASAFASAGDGSSAVRYMLDVEARLRRAGRSPWPDLLVPAIVLAYRNGEEASASEWYGAIRSSKEPQQTFHGIAIYRQLRSLLPAANEPMSLEQAGRAAMDWSRPFL